MIFNGPESKIKKSEKKEVYWTNTQLLMYYWKSFDEFWGQNEENLVDLLNLIFNYKWANIKINPL